MNTLFFKIIFFNFLLLQLNHNDFFKSSHHIEKTKKKDTIIENVKKSFIGKKINGDIRKKIISEYLIAINRQYERPEMSDVYAKDFYPLFKIYSYKKISIQNKLINTYYININFEDGVYESILLSSDNMKTPYKVLLIYEKLESATNYNCTSTINKDLIFVNRITDDSKTENHYIFKDNYFLDYFEKSETKINKEWGEQEFIQIEGEKKSVYEYKMKGIVKNHLKQGLWEERKFSLEKKTSITNKNNYLNGIILSNKK